MTASLTLTEDDIYGRLKTVWDAAGASSGVALVYDNVQTADGVAPPESGDVAWARASVQTGLSIQSAFGNGISRFENIGILSVQLFTPTGKGQKQSKSLVEVVLSAVRNHRTPNGVVFRGTEIVNIGVDGNWFRKNVLAGFEVEDFA